MLRRLQNIKLRAYGVFSGLKTRISGLTTRKPGLKTSKPGESGGVKQLLPGLNVGFQRGKPVGAFRQFLYSFLAFLTAKTLLLGLDAGGSGAISIVRTSGSQRVQWGRSSNDGSHDDDDASASFDVAGLAVKREYDVGVVLCGLSYSHITVADDDHEICYPAPDAKRAATRNYVFSPDCNDMVSLCNPCHAKHWFGAMSHSGALSGEGRSRVARCLLRLAQLTMVCGWCCFSILTVLDALIGGAMRALQAPYFVMIYLWHNCGGDCYHAKIDHKSRKRQCAVFKLRDQVFTCFAVLMNSVILVAAVSGVWLSLMGFSMPALTVAGFFAGGMAGLTTAGMGATVYVMRSKNAELGTQAEALARAIRGTEGVESGSLDSDRSCAQWEAACRAIARIMYLNAVIRGAYLPDHCSAGYCGVTALSFVEELCHAVPHLLSSVVLCGVHKCYGLPDVE